MKHRKEYLLDESACTFSWEVGLSFHFQGRLKFIENNSYVIFFIHNIYESCLEYEELIVRFLKLSHHFQDI